MMSKEYSSPSYGAEAPRSPLMQLDATGSLVGTPEVRASTSADTVPVEEQPRVRMMVPEDEHRGPPRIPHNMDTFDGKTSWLDYQIYFDEVAEFQRWTDREKAMVLIMNLRRSAREVLIGMPAAARHDYVELTRVLGQNFCPREQIYIHQAELRGRRQKPTEKMTDLGRDIARLVRLAYP